MQADTHQQSAWVAPVKSKWLKSINITVIAVLL